MTFIAFDLETTGFLPGVDQITEIGAVRFVNGSPESTFSTLVNPRKAIPSGAQQVTGITDEMVKDKPLIEDLLDSFADFCKDDLIVAHNASFDYQFLESDIKKHESRSPSGLILDTCAISRKVFPGLLNYKLGTLVKHLDIPSTGFHRAQEDATYCGHLFSKILEKVSVNGLMPEIENLIALSNKSALKFSVIEKRPKQLDMLSSL